MAQVQKAEHRCMLRPMWSLRHVGITSGLVAALLLQACAFDGTGTDQPAPPDIGVDQPTPDLMPPDLLSLEPPPPPCEESDCPLGCTVDRDRCYRLTPSNIDPQVFYGLGTAQLVLDGGTTQTIEIDTNTGAITGLRAPNANSVVDGIFYKTIAQQDGTRVAVFSAASLQVAVGTTVRIRGTLPVLFYLTTTATIDGVIEVRADASGPGPGGKPGGPNNGKDGALCLGAGKGGSQKDSIGVEWEAGGGGGGYGQDGAKGATVNCTLGSPAEGGSGGLAWGSTTLEPLTGGCGGGAGGGPDTLDTSGDGGRGGHGGGAIQISAGERLTIGATGGIDAAASGGEGGHYGAGGGGGGSGGAILLEAPEILLQGTLAANGGGGGAGSASALTENATDGKDGSLSKEQASAGLKDPIGLGTSGGKGGAAAGAASPGSDSAFDCNGGGGGGGAGRLHFNSNVPVTGGTLSPGSTTGLLKQPW